MYVNYTTHLQLKNIIVYSNIIASARFCGTTISLINLHISNIKFIQLIYTKNSVLHIVGRQLNFVLYVKWSKNVSKGRAKA